MSYSKLSKPRILYQTRTMEIAVVEMVVLEIHHCIKVIMGALTITVIITANDLIAFLVLL